MNLVIITSVLCQALVFYHIGKGNTPHRLMMLTYVLYCIVEGWLAYRDPSQSWVWLYIPLNLWCFFGALRGYNIKREIHDRDF